MAVPIRYDLLRFKKSSFSLGTNLKLGTEDEYGISFPIITVIGILSNGTAPNTDMDTALNHKIQFFSEIPLMLHYNLGLGSGKDRDAKFGFYIGGGATYMVTGVPDTHGGQKAVSFFGWVANIGIRFSEHGDLGFSSVLPFDNAIGPIKNPICYQLTLGVNF